MTTEFEAYVLNQIAHHEMNSLNGATPSCAEDVSTYCWADHFAGDKMTTNQCKGVLSSLVKKGFIAIQDWDKGDTLVGFTKSGFEAWEKSQD